ncbi:MAG: AtpZ/AtpI family protein [Flavobacteriales bacterium]|nr:AtpZ/AtpI family protein [Flavobacteriales bacterium]
MDNSSSKNYLKYSGIAFQMIGTILVLVYAGRWADKKLNLKTPWLTLLGAVWGVIISMIYLFRIGSKKD